MMRDWEQIPLEAETPLTDAIRSGEIIVCASPDEIATRYPWFDDSDQSFVAAPLVAAGRAIGGIFIGSAEARQYGGNLSLSSASPGRRGRLSTAPSCSSASARRSAGCASSRP